MSKLIAITKDLHVPLSLGLLLSLLGAVLYAGMQLQGLKHSLEHQWTYDMESAAWEKFGALNYRKYPDIEIPDIHSIRRNHAGIQQIPLRIAER